MSHTVHWTTYIFAVAIPAIAVIGAWIAFRQSEIARNKLKLDLFERRMEIYEAVRDMLGKAANRGKLSGEQEIQYLQSIQPAKWLFGVEVSRYLEEDLWKKMTDLALHNSMLETPPGEERRRHVQARSETMNWLRGQFKELDALCKPYLELKH